MFRNLCTQQRCTAAALPRRERLASARLQGEQALASIGKDADDALHGHANHLAATAHAQGNAIEVDVDHIEGSVSECVRHASRPVFSVAMTRDTALSCELFQGDTTVLVFTRTQRAHRARTVIRCSAGSSPTKALAEL